MALRWPVIGLLAVAGSLSVWLVPRAGLPDLWDRRSSPTRRLLLPGVVGLGLGVVALAFNGQLQAMAGRSVNIPFPESILFYSAGAIVVESLYRLVLITVPLWLMASVIPRGRGRTPVFWILALRTSLLEPVGQLGLLTGDPGLLLIIGLGMYGINVFDAFLFWRLGFLAPLTFRLAYYVVWHVVGSELGAA